MTDQTPGKFYLQLDCEQCDAEILTGLCLTLIRHNGHPVVPVTMMSQISATCGECGATHYTGDLDILVEEGDSE